MDSEAAETAFPVTVASPLQAFASGTLPTPGAREQRDVSVIVPVRNNADTLAELHRRLVEVLTAGGLTWEILLSDDGSQDGSWDVISDLVESDTNTAGVRFTRNFGQAPAIVACYPWSAGDVIVIIDADLEHMPEDLPRFLEKTREGHDLVSGVRPRIRQRRRRWPSAAFNWLMRRATGLKAEDLGCSYVAVRRRLADECFQSGEVLRNLMVMPTFIRGAQSWTEVPVRWGGDQRSAYSLFSLAMSWFECVFAYGRPFYWSILGGTALVALGLVAIVAAIGFAVAGSGGAATVMGLAALASVVLGIQLAVFGVFAHHVLRTSYHRGTPYFQVRSVIGVE